MVILSRYYAAITGDWFYDWRGIKPERYGFGYRCNDSAYIALINDRFSPSHFSVASSQHFATTLFFFLLLLLPMSYDYARILAIRSPLPIRSLRDFLEPENGSGFKSVLRSLLERVLYVEVLHGQ